MCVCVCAYVLTRACLRRQREYQRRRTFAPGDRTAQRLRLEAAQLLHKIGALHQCDVGEMQVAQNLVLISFAGAGARMSVTRATHRKTQRTYNARNT